MRFSFEKRSRCTSQLIQYNIYFMLTLVSWMSTDKIVPDMSEKYVQKLKNLYRFHLWLTVTIDSWRILLQIERKTVESSPHSHSVGQSLLYPFIDSKKNVTMFYAKTTLVFIKMYEKFKRSSIIPRPTLSHFSVRIFLHLFVCAYRFKIKKYITFMTF
jgi:hypothetical protein